MHNAKPQEFNLYRDGAQDGMRTRGTGVLRNEVLRSLRNWRFSRPLQAHYSGMLKSSRYCGSVCGCLSTDFCVSDLVFQHNRQGHKNDRISESFTAIRTPVLSVADCYQQGMI